MTGRTTARAAGGSELAVAWVRYGSSANNAKFPIVFEEGMTWAQWGQSEYYLYYDDDRSGYQFGLNPNITTWTRVSCYWISGVNTVWDRDNSKYAEQNGPIRAGVTYTTTT